MTDIEYTEAKLASLRAKLARTTDPEMRRYFELCLAGWEKWLEKLKANDTTI